VYRLGADIAGLETAALWRTRSRLTGLSL